MHRRIFLILAIVVLTVILWSLPLSHGRAQDQPALDTLKISFWPEYDQPSVLVIYRATLSPDTNLPVNVVFRIPPDAEPFVAAVGPSLDTVDEVTYNSKVTGEWKEVSFPATFPAIQFEYYDNSLSINDGKRHFEYQWPGEYAVATLSIEVQKPLDVGNISISPQIEDTQVREDGLEYYSSEIGPLTPGQAFKITLDYTKTSDDLTVDAMELQPSSPISATTTGRNRFRSILVGGLALLGVALIAGGGWWYWQSGRKKPSASSRKRSRGKRAVASEVEALAGGDIYCHQCGKRASPGDRFCRSCGTRLRVE